MIPGISRHAPGGRMQRHRHAEGYIALVLSGGYVEAGDQLLAARSIPSWQGSLAELAFELGFADQSHGPRGRIPDGAFAAPPQG
jgi:hypothetical protein